MTRVAIYGEHAHHLSASLRGRSRLEPFEVASLDGARGSEAINLLALVVGLDSASEDDANSLRAFKRSHPAVPIIVAVKNASLDTARIALDCRAWHYLEIADSIEPLCEALRSLTAIRAGVSARWSRIPVFPKDSGSPQAAAADTFAAHVVRDAIGYVDRHLDRPLVAASVAGAVKIDTRTLQRYFKASQGIGLREFIRLRRLCEAASLLRQTRLSIKEIATRCGFSDSAHMVRQFGIRFGMTPGEYRRNR
jgi:AraC-like DNA-binding protein